MGKEGNGKLVLFSLLPLPADGRMEEGESVEGEEEGWGVVICVFPMRR